MIQFYAMMIYYIYIVSRPRGRFTPTRVTGFFHVKFLETRSSSLSTSTSLFDGTNDGTMISPKDNRYCEPQSRLFVEPLNFFARSQSVDDGIPPLFSLIIQAFRSFAKELGRVLTDTCTYTRRTWSLMGATSTYCSTKWSIITTPTIKYKE